MYFLQMFVRCPQMYNEFKEYKKHPTLNYLRSWNLRPNPKLVICFLASLLMISFEDLILAFYIWVYNTTIEVAVKKNPT